jgi:hypothetical protein
MTNTAGTEACRYKTGRNANGVRPSFAIFEKAKSDS